MSKNYSRLYSMMLKYFKQSEEYSRCLALNYFPSQIPAYRNSVAYKNGLYFMEFVSDKKYNLYCDLRYLFSSSFRDYLKSDINELHIISNELNLINETVYLNENLCYSIHSDIDLSSFTFVISIGYLKLNLFEYLFNLNANIILNEKSITFSTFESINEVESILNILSSLDLDRVERINLSFWLSDLSSVYIFLERFFSCINTNLISVDFCVKVIVLAGFTTYIDAFSVPSGSHPVKFTFNIVNSALLKYHLYYNVNSINGCWNISLVEK